VNGGLIGYQLRNGRSDTLQRRRKIAGLSLLSIGSMAVISLYQLGLTRRLPDPPLSVFNSEKVTGSAEGYMYFNVPDSVLGIGSSAMTLGLAAMSSDDRARSQAWLPIALAGKTVIDLVVAGKLAVDQVTKHKALCSWCLVSGITAIGNVALSLPEARRAFSRITA
jgi:uncharacterized membrane protein